MNDYPVTAQAILGVVNKFKDLPASTSRATCIELLTEAMLKLGTGLEQEVGRLGQLVYVPGLLKCAKCKFVLSKRTLYMQSGTVGANNAPDTCPNCNVPMWRVSERDYRNDIFADMLEMRNTALEQAAVICETQITSDNARGRLQSASILNRAAATIRDRKTEKREQLQVTIPRDPCEVLCRECKGDGICMKKNPCYNKP